MTIENSSGDPDMSEELLIKQLNDDEAVVLSLEENFRDLCGVMNEMSADETISKSQAMALESLFPGIFGDDCPLASFTQHPSKTNYAIAIEAIDEAKSELFCKIFDTLVANVRRVVSHSSADNGCNQWVSGVNTEKQRLQLSVLDDLLAHMLSGGTPHRLVDEYKQRTAELVRDWLTVDSLAFIADYFLMGTTRDIFNQLRDDLSVGSFALESRIELLNRALQTMPDVDPIRFDALRRTPIIYKSIGKMRGICEPGPTDVDTLGSFITNVIGSVEIRDLSPTDINVLINNVLDHDLSSDSMLDKRLADIRDNMRHIKDLLGLKYNSETKTDEYELCIPDTDAGYEVIIEAVKLISNDLLTYVQMRYAYGEGMSKLFKFSEELIDRLCGAVYDNAWMTQVLAEFPGAGVYLAKIRSID